MTPESERSECVTSDCSRAGVNDKLVWYHSIELACCSLPSTACVFNS